MDNYCLPIIESSREKVPTIIADHLSKYGFFEVWLDYIEQEREALVRSLVEEYPGRIIFLFRRQNLEEITMDRNERNSIIDTLHDRDAFLDLDIGTQEGEISYIGEKDLNIKSILSYHNYDLTPSELELREILSKMKENNPTIVKFSTYCNSKQDSLRLLLLQDEIGESGIKHIVLGMGAYGIVTRIFGPFWGNELSFAPVSLERSSAPGQLSREELDNILKIIGERCGG